MVPVHDEDGDEANPEDDIAPPRTDGGDGTVPFVFDYVAGTAAQECAHGRKEEEQNDEKSMEVVVTRARMNKKMPVKHNHDYDTDQLRPEHLFLKA